MPESFTEQIISTLKHILPDVQITVQQINKPGEQHLTGLCMRSDKTNLVPILYLDRPYLEYCHGVSIDQICNGIRQMYEENCFTDSFDTSVITDWSKVSERVCTRLINQNRNTAYLKDKILQPIDGTDISFLYYIDLDTFTEGATVPVSQQLFSGWNIPIETLHQTALDNTARLHLPKIRSMAAVMSEMLGNNESYLADDPCMYVITSQKMLNGAVLALLPDVCSELRQKLGDFYLLPSSINEMLAVPQSLQTPDMLLAMVTEINHSQVSEQDFLADDVYIMQDGKLVSALSNEEKNTIRRHALSYLPFPEIELD